MKLAIQKIARAIACEHTSRAIRTMRPGSESDDHELSIWVPKPGNRAPPVILNAKRAAFCARNFFAVSHQARTLPALNNLFVQCVESFQNVKPTERAVAILLYLDGQVQPGAASVGLAPILKRQASAMCFSDLPAEHQSNSRPAGLGGEERNE